MKVRVKTKASPPKGRTMVAQQRQVRRKVQKRERKGRPRLRLRQAQRKSRKKKLTFTKRRLKL